MREQVKNLTREFSSICTDGKILYLGTPQTKDSIYNGLPARGFTIRIWPGRYPTNEELERYGEHLAPYHLERIHADPSLQSGGGIDGKRGKPADPGRYGEEALCEKELDQGPEGFQLQYMLDTSLADAARKQLKLENLLIGNFDNELLPEILVWQSAERHRVSLPLDFALPRAVMYHGIVLDNPRFVKRAHTCMFIDPAGGGKDELAWAIGTAVGPYIHVLSIGGVRGGFTDANATIIIEAIKEFGVDHIQCEANGGLGYFEKLLRAELSKADLLETIKVESVWSTGQKERRIMESLVGVTQRHRLVLHQRVLEDDTTFSKAHALDQRTPRSLFHQFDNLTTDRGSLSFDDRLDALAGLVRIFSTALALDEQEAARERHASETAAFLADPMGYGTAAPTRVGGTRNRLSRRGR